MFFIHFLYQLKMKVKMMDNTDDGLIGAGVDFCAYCGYELESGKNPDGTEHDCIIGEDK